jgi:hypothetical protein
MISTAARVAHIALQQSTPVRHQVSFDGRSGNGRRGEICRQIVSHKTFPMTALLY